MGAIDYILSNMTAWVMRGALPSEMWEGLPYTKFVIDGKLWEVSDECSGKMLLFYLLFTATWRLLIYRHKGCWKLFALALPLTLAFNAIRCYVVMRYSIDPMSHDLLGFLVYAVVVFGCFFVPLDDSNYKRSDGGDAVTKGESK